MIPPSERIRWACLAALAVAGLGCEQRPGAAVAWLTAQTPASHERFFPIASGVHQRTCNDCHGSSDTFRGFDCTTCHTEAQTTPRHSGVGGFLWESASCYLCHPNGPAAGVDHSKRFPIAAGAAHAGIACATCHLDPQDGRKQACTTCHAQSAMAGKHSLAGGYAWTSDLCLRCHADSQVDRVAAHLPFRIASGAHANKSCLVCHLALRADKPWAADFTQKDCLGCHHKSEMDSQHRSRAGYAYATAVCLGCHPDGRN